jgi:hypothetical protein
MALPPRRTEWRRSTSRRCEVAAGRCSAQPTPILDAIRSIGVTEVAYYRWRNEYGRLQSDQVKRLKDLEAENARLRKAISDPTLDKLILHEAAGEMCRRASLAFFSDAPAGNQMGVAGCRRH